MRSHFLVSSAKRYSGLLTASAPVTFLQQWKLNVRVTYYGHGGARHGPDCEIHPLAR